jgi:hypothetical protein
MKNIMIDGIRYVALIAGIALMHCSGSDRLAGAGSQTTNGIMVAGVVHNADGTPALHAEVRLFPDDYKGFADSQSIKPSTDTTDAGGAFTFTRVDSGLYTIIARNKTTLTSAMLTSIQVTGLDSIVTTMTCNLQHSGAIKIDLARTPDTSAEYVFIPGTDIFSPITNNDGILLGNVPAGTIPAVSYATRAGEVYGIRSAVIVAPEDTVVIRNPSWKYSQKISFNTSGGGAGVAQDVYDFPVLLRLNGNNFNFQEAQADGRDIRFAKADNSFLPFEIERWNPAAKLAEVWVKVDTLHGNGTGQTISMYWGNAQAPATSDAYAVFDTAQGFQGVWHLSESIVDSVRDATGNHFNGVAAEMTEASITAGMIGDCRTFDGKGYITVPNTAAGKLSFQQDGNYTVSAWVNVDTLDTLSHVVLSKGIFEYYLWFTSIYQNTPYWEFVNYKKPSGWDCAIQLAVSKQWILLTAVRNATSQALYVNGEIIDTTHIKYSSTSQPTTPTDLVIGRYFQSVPYTDAKGGFCWFNGKIDEVRVCSRSQSAEWIRLCYMNQKADDKLTTINVP